MALDPRIILSGSQPNLVNAFSVGQETRARSGEIRNQNALRELLREQGPNILAGEQNALNDLSRFDPNAALGVQSNRLGIQRQKAALESSRRLVPLSARGREEFDRRNNLLPDTPPSRVDAISQELFGTDFSSLTSDGKNAVLARASGGGGEQGPLDEVAMQVFGRPFDDLPTSTQNRVAEIVAADIDPDSDNARRTLGPGQNTIELNTQALIDAGADPAIAGQIASGRVIIRQNPETGLISFIDLVTRRVLSTLQPEQFNLPTLGQGSQGQTTPAPTAPAQPQGVVNPGVEFLNNQGGVPRANPDFSGSTGVTGVITNLSNAAASFLGRSLPAPAANEARNQINSLVERTAVALATDSQSGRAALQTINGFKSTLPQAGAVFEGPEASLSKVRNTIDQLTRQMSETLSIAQNPSQFSRGTVSNARAKALSLQAMLAEWQRIERAIDLEISDGQGQGGGNTGVTPNGITFEVIQ